LSVTFLRSYKWREIERSPLILIYQEELPEKGVQYFLMRVKMPVNQWFGFGQQAQAHTQHKMPCVTDGLQGAIEEGKMTSITKKQAGF
jgi:hypothetical protein